MDYETAKDIATIAGGFATLIATIIGGIALIIARWQINSSKFLQNETNAKSIYREYLLNCLNYPKFHSPTYSEIQKSGNFPSYEIFVAQMLFSLEEILLFTKLPGWNAVARAQIQRHSDYLCSVHFHENKIAMYDPNIRNMIIECKTESEFTKL